MSSQIQRKERKFNEDLKFQWLETSKITDATKVDVAKSKMRQSQPGSVLEVQQAAVKAAEEAAQESFGKAQFKPSY